ncbi:MAG TPA: DUF427 domain-containing protein [Jatrophihabitans sp.]|nr:DUF427 domain-containing protein [Jatrophihabitans sp.]
MKIPGADHPITIDKTDERIIVRVGDRVVAESTTALRLDEAGHRVVYYLPIEDVDQSVLRRSEHATYCPFKGDASYYDVVTEDVEIANAIWTYEQPYDAVREIAGHVAFYRHLVEITAE